MMLTKMDNPKLSYIARLMVLPLAVLVFAAFTFKARPGTPQYDDKINAVVDNLGQSIDTIPQHNSDDFKTAVNIDTVDYYKIYGKAATYNGQKIKSVTIRKSDSKAIVELVNGKKIVLTQEQALKAEIIAPPPPPPPPPQFDPALPANDLHESTIQTSVKRVLYIGINNPVMAFASGIKAEDLVLEISSGTLSGTNGNNYVARVTHPEKVILTLRKLGDPKILNSFEFMAKRLPDITDPEFPKELRSMTKPPVVKFADPSVHLFVGSYRGGSITLDELKAQKELKVSAGYNFVSATVYFSYPATNSLLQLQLNSASVSAMNDAINRCTPGCTLIFDKVYIKDNNGEVKMVLNPPGFSVIEKSPMEM